MKRYKTSTIIIAVVGLVLFVSIPASLVIITVLGEWEGISAIDVLETIYDVINLLLEVSILVLILIILVCIVANRFFGKSYRLKIPLILLIVMTALRLVLIPIENLFPFVIVDMPLPQLPPDIPSDYFERMQNK